MMAKTYVTTQGDTWDRIALETLGSENLLPLLLENNQRHRKILIFPSDITLSIPEVDISEMTERPDWLNEDEDL